MDALDRQSPLSERQINFICWLLLFVGLLLRLIYAMRVPYDISPHDLGRLPDEHTETYGHLGYIYYLYKHKWLLNGIRRQFYHPPLFHILAASIYDIVVLFGANEETAFECIQFCNAYVAGGCAIVMYLLLKRLPIRKVYLIPATAFLAFFPAFYYMGTELNNDCLATLFSLLSIYAAFLWAQMPDNKHFLLVAVFYLLSVWTKWSGILQLPILFCIFCLTAWEKRLRRKKVLWWCLVFGLIVIPLSMVWMLYLIGHFGVSFFYTPSLSPDSRQYIGDITIGDRIWPAFFWGLVPLATDLSGGAEFGNIWTQTIRTAAFDEGILTDPNPLLGTILLWGIWLWGLICLICIVWLIADQKVDALYRIVLPLGFLLTMMAYIVYSFRVPYISAINFRYIPCVLVYESAAAWIVLSGSGIKRRLLRCLMFLSVMVISVESTLLYGVYV